MFFLKKKKEKLLGPRVLFLSREIRLMRTLMSVPHVVIVHVSSWRFISFLRAINHFSNLLLEE